MRPFVHPRGLAKSPGSSRPSHDRDSGPPHSPSFSLSPARRGGGVDGRGLGHLLPGTSASGSLDLCCGCPSPFQCEGAHGPSHLPARLPSPLRRSPLSLLADGQFHVDGMRSPRRMHSISPSSSPHSPDPSRPPALDLDPSGLCFFREETSSGDIGSPGHGRLLPELINFMLGLLPLPHLPLLIWRIFGSSEDSPSQTPLFRLIFDSWCPSSGGALQIRLALFQRLSQYLRDSPPFRRSDDRSRLSHSLLIKAWRTER